MSDGEKLATLAHLSIIKDYIDKNDKEVLDNAGTIASEEGILGIRVWGGKFQYKQTDGTWADISDVSSSGSGDSPITDGDLADESDIDSIFS